MKVGWRRARFSEFLRPRPRPYQLGADEDANLVGMRWYGEGPFHRELKSAMNIAKKSHFVIRHGDVIYNKLFAWKGTFGIVPVEFDRMFVSDKFPTYELDRSEVDESYLRWYFRYPPLWEEAKAMSTGSAAISKLTLNPPQFLDLTIPLPPTLYEQRDIIASLERTVAKITEARRLRKQSQAEAGAILRATLRRIAASLRVEGTLADILLRPPRNGWSAKCDNAEDGTAVLSLAAVTGFRYRAREFKRTSLYAASNGDFWLNPGDLLITRSNTPELVGHAAIYDGTPAPCIFPDLMMRLTLNHEIADTRFTWYWLQAPIVRAFIAAKAKGTSPTMKKIAQGTVAAIPFPSTLPLSEQQTIVAKLDAIQEQIDRLNGLAVDTEKQIDALIPSILDRTFKSEL
jgi:type I restriction enzyme, S subunit